MSDIKYCDICDWEVNQEEVKDMTNIRVDLDLCAECIEKDAKRLADIKEMTADNDHTAARLEAAILLNSKPLKLEYAAILTEQERVGYMGDLNMLNRKDADKKLLKLAQEKMTADQYKEFKLCI